MKQKLLIAAAAAALMAAPSFASAQDGSGWYLKGGLGYGAHTDLDITEGIVGDTEAEANGVFNLGLGFHIDDNWRLELDGTSMYNDHGGISNTPASFAKLRTDALMINALYDFNDFGKWAPYVGAGVGLVRSDATLSSHDFPNVDNNGQIRNPTCVGSRSTADGFDCNYNDEDSGLGWQLLAGLGYDITEKLTWDTSYRYMQASDMDFSGTFSNALTGASTPAQAEVEGIGAHQILTGFRYKFGASAPKPPMVKPAVVETADYKCWDNSMVFNAGQCPAKVVEVAPEPTVRCWDGTMVFAQGECSVQPEVFNCPDGSFVYDVNQCPISDGTMTRGDLCGESYRQEIIYYEFNKGASAETRNTISRILDAGEFCNVENVRVVGHTDTSGAASYNLALSKRRANDALNELVRQGLDRSLVSSDGKGETEPFVQTGEGVKEPLNRRTEVLITLGSLGAMTN